MRSNFKTLVKYILQKNKLQMYKQVGRMLEMNKNAAWKLKMYNNKL